MGYLTQSELELLGFKALGEGVRISRKASIYDCHLICIGDFCRIDDYCILSGNVNLGSGVSFAPFCLIAGGNKEEDLQNGGIVIKDSCTFAYGVKIFSRSDDYVNNSKNVFIKAVVINKNSIVGTNAVIFPGAVLESGCSVGAFSLVKGRCVENGLYVGIPAKLKLIKTSAGGGGILSLLLLKMAKKIALYLLGYKGFYTLQEIIANKKHLAIAYVVSTYDKAQEDYCLEIQRLCKENGILFFLNADAPKNTPPFIFAISWRLLIHSNARVIVLHDSILPKYRGFNPLVSALINGDREIGVTALFGECEYDSGDILAQKTIKIKYPLTILEAIYKISILYSQIVLELIEKIINKIELIGIPQDKNLISYSLWRDDRDYWISWDSSAKRIERFINAVGFPYGGARAFCGEDEIKILKAVAIDDVKITNRDIGKVIFKDENNPVVVCKEGLLKILQMQYLNGDAFLCKKFRVRFYSKEYK